MRRPQPWFAPALAVPLLGCVGSIDEERGGGAGDPQGGRHADPAAAGSEAPAAAGAPAPAAAPGPGGGGQPQGPGPSLAAPGLPGEPEAIPISRENVRLLPFETRLARLAAIAGLPVTDKLFDPFRQKRLELGDYDWAKSVGGDSAWSAARMVQWIRLVRPLCQSGPVRSRFSGVAANPAPLIGVAFGRPADRADLDGVEAGIAKADARDEVACIAILSSLELLSR
jgi:hypothetical protein